MSIFNIKLKTKAGNDVKKKETFTVFFKLNYKPGKKVTAEYAYQISYSKGVIDPRSVKELRMAQDVKSLEDLTLKVMLNFCHMIGKLTKANNIDPDFILFISPDFEGKKNRAWQFLSSAFKRPKKENKDEKRAYNEDPLKWLTEYEKDFNLEWTEKECKKLQIKKEELDMIKYFADANPNTMFMTIDPNRDRKKYEKSLHICDRLQDRLDRITTNNLVNQP